MNSATGKPRFIVKQIGVKYAVYDRVLHEIAAWKFTYEMAERTASSFNRSAEGG
jgi:hypothetical protein